MNNVANYNFLNESKYLVNQNVYDTFVEIHKSLNLIEYIPKNWNGETVDDAVKYLNIREKGIKIKTPIDEIIIYKSHMEHLIKENDIHRKNT